MEKQWLRIADVLGELSLSRSELYRFIDRGELTPLKLGRAVRFDRADVEAFRARKRKEATDRRETAELAPARSAATASPH